MQSKTTRNYIIGVIAIIVIAIAIAFYVSRNRSDNKEGSMASSTASTTEAKPNFITLKNFKVETKSDVSGWMKYNNPTYKFSLKYPPNVSVRKFIGGNDEEYGIAFTINQPDALFSEKYFEMTAEVGKSTVCDALLDARSSEKSASIGDLSFIRREYNDGTSHVIEYVAKPSACYRGYLRLNNPSNGKAVAPNGDQTSESEAQILEDIMSTFRFVK